MARQDRPGVPLLVSVVVSVVVNALRVGWRPVSALSLFALDLGGLIKLLLPLVLLVAKPLDGVSEEGVCLCLI
ncbi:hypothetical protein Vqi01_55720 [Micromonospora qiuiae]|uniref:Uncharacterized protein n=1 Tax=Micromonospora qiuiae TaxID=502268 RepID=A0ABQ4JJ79_9ACTN|nr:hypothetical protein Vqi01_55720 [Micromonospora qiuiae]